MNKTELHAIGAELTAAITEEINIYDFTDDEVFDETYHQNYSDIYIFESWEYVMDILTDDDDVNFAKKQYPLCIAACERLIPEMPVGLLEKYGLTPSSKSIFQADSLPVGQA